MHPEITSIENLIASDPGGRNIFGMMATDQLRLAAQSLRQAKRVAIVSGFYVPDAGAGETDGPPGAKVLGEALNKLGIQVDYITDALNAPLFHALGIPPNLVAHVTGVRAAGFSLRESTGLGGGSGARIIAQAEACGSAEEEETGSQLGRYINTARPTHLVAIERVGRGSDGCYRNMRGMDITGFTAPLDELFLNGRRSGLTTIGIGDGGNEIGMGKIFAPEPRASARADPPDADPAEPATTVTASESEPQASACADPPDAVDPAAAHTSAPRCTVATDFCIAAGVSNWGAYGLTGALSILTGRDLLPSAERAARDVEDVVRVAGAVDGVTHRQEPTVDGLELAASLQMLESIRRQISPSPLLAENPLCVGILGYGETGRSAATLLTRRGHRVCVSDEGPVHVEQGTRLAGLETGGHTIDFFTGCDLVVTSPGVPADRPILGELHRRGIPVMSELELAYQLYERGRESHRVSRVPHRFSGGAVHSTHEGCLIAVTGTIGKRSTIELLHHVFLAADRPLLIGGNRGRPLSELLLDHDGPSDPAESGRTLAGQVPIALAVSSFQLESVVRFRPNIAVLLNIDEAHLDRHRSFAEYVRIKSRVFMNHGSDDVLILPFDDERLRMLARKHHGRTLFISARQSVDRGAWLADGVLKMNLDGIVETVGTVDAPFSENVLAVALTARLCGIPVAHIAAALAVPHGGSDPRASDGDVEPRT